MELLLGYQTDARFLEFPEAGVSNLFGKKRTLVPATLRRYLLYWIPELISINPRRLMVQNPHFVGQEAVQAVIRKNISSKKDIGAPRWLGRSISKLHSAPPRELTILHLKGSEGAQ